MNKTTAVHFLRKELGIDQLDSKFIQASPKIRNTSLTIGLRIGAITKSVELQRMLNDHLGIRQMMY
jgi:hypothetical protein